MTTTSKCTKPAPNGEEISEVREDIHLDIDRWENDGGRSINTWNSSISSCIWLLLLKGRRRVSLLIVTFFIMLYIVNIMLVQQSNDTELNNFLAL